MAHDSVSPDTGAVLPDFPSAKDATVTGGWEPDPSESTCKNMLPLDQVDVLPAFLSGSLMSGTRPLPVCTDQQSI